MFFEIVLAMFLGIFFGIITGLIPGVHVNLVAIILVGGSGELLKITSPFILAIFIVSLALTHTFLDSIPAIFLGAPDSDMVLGVLPGHRMLLAGEGYGAVKLTVIGSLSCLIITLMLIPIIIPFLGAIFEFINPYMAWILISVVVGMIILDKKKWYYGFYLFFQSGVLGLMVLNMPGLSQPLFPMLSGLFGISTLILSVGQKTKIPNQKLEFEVKVGWVERIKAIVAGVFSGSLTGLFPGLGAAQASIIGSILVGSVGIHAFLILIGGINTVNFAFSIATFFALDKARNGAIVAVSDLVESINTNELGVIILVCLVVGCIAAILALTLAKAFSKIVSRVNYNYMAFGIIGLIFVLVLVFSSWIGLVVLIVSTCIGMMPALIGVKRSHNMGCLLLPVILFFL